MLVHDFRKIGNKMLHIRKRLGLTQSELAEIAGVSDRTYADIERGSVNMRMETALKICEVLHVTPNEIFTEENTPLDIKQEELFMKLDACTPHQRETAHKILSVYLDSLYWSL